MGLASVLYTNQTGTGPFNFTFPYISTAHIKVEKNGILLTAGTHYTVSTSPTPQITLMSPLVAADTLLIFRQTPGRAPAPNNAPLVDFTDGSVLTAADLDKNTQQLLYLVQESEDGVVDTAERAITIPLSDGNLNMGLPTAALRANTFLAFDANGLPSVVTAGSSGAPATITRQVFSGTGSQTVFTLASNPGGVGNSAQVYIGGVYQQRSTYTIVGTSLTFSQAPVAGTNNIEFVNFLTSSVGTTSADLVTYTPAGSGAVARSAASKFGEVVSVKDFGAVGNGVADDTAAIQAALSAAGAGTSVFFPAGTYLISTTLTVGSPYVTIVGEGWGSIIKQSSVAVSSGGISCSADGLTVTNIKIESPTQTGNENVAIRVEKSASAAVYDIHIQDVWFEKFTYAVVAINPHRCFVHNNYIYSTGDNSTDTGGAIQMAGAVQTTISGNIITGDAANKFQHGIYISGDISETVVTANAISDGFYSYGIHIYGTTFTTGRFGMIVSENQINDVPNGIIFSNSGVANANVRAVSIIDNKVYTSLRCVFVNGSDIANLIIDGNYFRSGGSAAGNPILEITQSGGQTATDVQITNNVFKDFKDGGIDLNNAVAMTGIRIENNTFDPATSGDSCITLDDPSTVPMPYSNIVVRGNRNVGAKTISVSPTFYSGYKQAAWMTMDGNSFDPESWTRITAVTSTPYTVAQSDQTIFVTTGASTITVNLPNVTGGGALNGRVIHVVKIDNGAGAVTIDATGSQTINGSLTYTLATQYDSVRLVLINGQGWLAS